MLRESGIQYSGSSLVRTNDRCGLLDRPVQPGDDDAEVLSNSKHHSRGGIRPSFALSSRASK
jgi:hypothetical protein